MALEVNASGKVLGADTDNILIAGFALTDAASGAMCSCITGSGIVLNVHLDGTADIDIGQNLVVGQDGALVKSANVDGDSPVAIALEAATDTAAINASSTLPLANPGVSLYKVLVK
jgi:hypothetical protein